MAQNRNQVALVTGAGGGIGRAITSGLAARDWRVVVNDIEGSDQAARVVDELIQQGSDALLTIADVGDPAQVETMYASVRAWCGSSPDLLVNNAGVQSWKPLLEVQASEWDAIIRTNLTGCFLNTQRFARERIQDQVGGVVVNIGSGCNSLAFPNLVAYTASKSGIEMLTKSSALELGSHGIRVNCIAPGAVETDRTRGETGDFVASWSALTPLGRIGTPSDVADAVAFLASDEAAFISGQTLGVDGGLFSRAIWPSDY